MRIDLNAAALSQLPADRETKQVKSRQSSSVNVVSQGPGSTSSAARTEDTATLSSRSLLLSSLATSALQSPPVRLDRVDAVSQALHSGRYELNPSKIADAIVADRVG